MSDNVNQYWWMRYTAPSSKCDTGVLALDRNGIEYTRKQALDYMATNCGLDSEELLSRDDCPRYVVGKKLILADVLANRDANTAFTFSEKLHIQTSASCDQAAQYFHWVKIIFVHSLSDVTPANTYFAAKTPDKKPFANCTAKGLDQKSYRGFALYKDTEAHTKSWILQNAPALELFWAESVDQDKRVQIRCCNEIFKQSYQSVNATGLAFYPARFEH